MFYHTQFHVKLADALRAVQSSEVGEDPTKAEGAMNMLDEFQQSIGNFETFDSSHFVLFFRLLNFETKIRLGIIFRRPVRRSGVGSPAVAGPVGSAAARRRRPGTAGIRPPTREAARPVLPAEGPRRPGPSATRLEHGATPAEEDH